MVRTSCILICIVVPSRFAMLSRSVQTRLLAVADAEIARGLAGGHADQAITLELEPEELRGTAASFVTLHKAGALRGCIGSIIARRPLLLDVAANAFAAAFLDPRFPALSMIERPAITLSISVLTPLTPIVFATDEELYATLRAGIDGVVLSHQNARATFLPEVWEMLPEPRSARRQAPTDGFAQRVPSGQRAPLRIVPCRSAPARLASRRSA